MAAGGAALLLALSGVTASGSEDAAAPAEPAAAGPGHRSAHALVHHDGLRRTLLVGGVPDDVEGGVWAREGTGWIRLGDDEGPGSRGHFALAAEPGSDRVLLHGGFGLRPGREGGERHGDLWAWNGLAWELVHDASVGPGVRDHHAMVLDRARGELVLFGGGRGAPGDQVLLGDTWIRDASGWRRVHGPGPPARATHRLAWDDARERAVLFGGWGDEGLLGDTWEWDGSRWELVAEDGPQPRFAARIAWDGILERVVLYGGRSASGNLGDTWEWDGRAWTPFGTAGPGARNVHALAWDADRARLVLAGGRADHGRLADTWERDGRRWMRVDRPEGPSPAPRGAAVGGFDPTSGRLLVFGGVGAEPAAFGDLWAWESAGWAEMSPPGGGPSPRFNAAGAFLSAEGQLVIHGGGGIDERRGDTWILESGSWRRHPGEGPAPRTCARMVERPDRGDLVLYGGAGEGGKALAETWRWDGEAWELLATEGPPGVCFHALAHDAARGRLVHFGGRGETEPGSATWIFDDAGWRELDVEGPPARDHHAMAWDAAREEVVLFGGGGRDAAGRCDGSARNDTWVWNGERWRRRHDPGGPGRLHAPLLSGTPDGVLLFGGGDGERSRADLWQWDGSRWHLLVPDASD